MSRIGKLPVAVPDGVTVALDGATVSVKGPRGTLAFEAPPEVEVAHADGAITVTPRGKDKRSRQMWGMSRTRIQNLVTGVTDGFERWLELTGVGYRAAMQGSQLSLNLGLSHPVLFSPPPGVTIEVPQNTQIKLMGIDRELVGQAAAEIRKFRPPEPYKGKGIAYRGEHIHRKSPRKAQAGV